MKFSGWIIIVFLSFLSIPALGQKITVKPLKAATKKDFENKKHAVIYGNFIQRLGLSSGGFAQEIKIFNPVTNEMFSLQVKPTFKSAKENTFCFIIKPGTYKIINYMYVESKVYGGKIFNEPVFKTKELIESNENLNKDINEEKYKARYSFTIAENEVYYVGTWNFDDEIPLFSDDKVEFDEIIKTDFPINLLEKAKIAIPD
jgi:hypothetical protein